MLVEDGASWDMIWTMTGLSMISLVCLLFRTVFLLLYREDLLDDLEDDSDLFSDRCDDFATLALSRSYEMLFLRLCKLLDVAL